MSVAPDLPRVNWWQRSWFYPLLVFVTALCCYANTLPNGWAVDDSVVVQQNRFVKRGVAGIDSILRTDAFYGFYGTNLKAVSGGRWRPLTPVLFALATEMVAPLKTDSAGKVVHDAAGYTVHDTGTYTLLPPVLHGLNVLLFAFLCALLYKVLLWLFRQSSPAGGAQRIAFGTALLFAVHPIHTEVVANIKSCDEILALSGALLTLSLVLKALETGERSKKFLFLAGSMVCFLGALLAKETAVSFVIIVPLALVFFRRVKPGVLLAYAAPLLVAAGIYGALRTGAVGWGTPKPGTFSLMNDPFLVVAEEARYAPLVPGSAIQKITNPNRGTIARMPFENRAATVGYTLGMYLKLLVLPHPLTCDYYPRHIEVKSFSDLPVLLAIAVNALLLFWALLKSRFRSWAGFGVLFYFITLAPVANVVFAIGTNMAERFLFMPSVGFCLCVAVGFCTLAEKWKGEQKALSRRGTALVAGLICIVFSTLTILRNPDWKNNHTLFSKDILVSENSGKLNLDLAHITTAIAVERETSEQLKIEKNPGAQREAQLQEIRDVRDARIRETLPLLQKALEINPVGGTAWIQLGQTYHLLSENKRNLPQESLTCLLTEQAAYEQTGIYTPINAGPQLKEYQGTCYKQLGRLMGQQFGNADQSVAYLEKARACTPNDAEVYFLLGTAYSMKQQKGAAIASLQRCLALRSDDSLAHRNLNILLDTH